MEEVLEDLIKLVGEAFPHLKTVDEDYGQLEMLDDEGRDTYPLTFPAVLIDAPETSWTGVSGLDQRGTCRVRVRLVLDCYDDTHWRSGTVEAIRERERMRKDLHVLLQGHRVGADGQALVRVSSRFYTWNHGIKVYESAYELAVSEYIRKETVAAGDVGIRIRPALEL